jgi:hypothetical protein
MARRLLSVLVCASIVALAGCTESSEKGPTGPDGNGGGGTNNTAVLGPKTLVSRSQASGDIPGAAQTARPFVKDFQVDVGYDELLLSFHVSGVGNYQLTIKNKANATMLYDTGAKSSQNAPDSHDHSGGGVSIAAYAGNFTLTLSWDGAITYHLDLIEKVKGTKSDDHQH